ncbi:MAG: hypothetical protein P8100_01870 [bacterium]|jgi:hypothetical protein
MKRSIFYIIALAGIILTACGGNLASKMIGTWKVVDVQTEFNEAEVTPEMLSQVVERERKTYFRIVDDSTLVIISNNNTHEARWIIDEDSGEITYFFEGMEANPNVLGTYEEGRVVHESNTQLGRITTVYERE